MGTESRTKSAQEQANNAAIATKHEQSAAAKAAEKNINVLSDSVDDVYRKMKATPSLARKDADKIRIILLKGIYDKLG